MEDKGGQLRRVLITFIVLCYLFTSLRCFVRAKFTKLALDDLFAVLSLIVYTGLCADLFYGIGHGGVGQHVYDVPTNVFATGLKTFLIAEMIYVVCTALIKLAFAITLLNIMDKRVYVFTTYATYTVIFVVVFQALFYFFYMLFSCRPVSYLWGRLDPSQTGTCQPPHQLTITSYTHGVVIFVCDLTLAVLPIVLISTLQLNRRTKVTTSVLLGLGAIASVVTLARLPFIHRLKNPDGLYVNIELDILSVTEVGISIIATSAGTFRPLLVWVGIFPVSNGTPRSNSWLSNCRQRRADGLDSEAPTTSTDVESVSVVPTSNEKRGESLSNVTVGLESVG